MINISIIEKEYKKEKKSDKSNKAQSPILRRPPGSPISNKTSFVDNPVNCFLIKLIDNNILISKQEWQSKLSFSDYLLKCWRRGWKQPSRQVFRNVINIIEDNKSNVDCEIIEELYKIISQRELFIKKTSVTRKFKNRSIKPRIISV